MTWRPSPGEFVTCVRAKHDYTWDHKTKTHSPKGGVRQDTVRFIRTIGEMSAEIEWNGEKYTVLMSTLIPRCTPMPAAREQVEPLYSEEK